MSSSTTFVISREFDVPRNVVWKAFTDPVEMQNWWGPKGATIGTSKMDVRPGGMYLYSMRTSDGSVMWGRMVYREIEAPKRLHFINSFSDEAGALTRHPLAPTWPIEMLSTFNFDETPNGTKFTVHWQPLNPTTEEQATFDSGHASMTGGWTGTLDKLSDYLDRIRT